MMGDNSQSRYGDAVVISEDGLDAFLATAAKAERAADRAGREAYAAAQRELDVRRRQMGLI
jgi:hypothetical protein